MRRPFIALTLLGMACALAGCGSSTSTTNQPTAAAVTIAATPTPTPVPTPPPTPTPPVPCMPGQFEIVINNTQGAAGTIFATFEIRNTSTTPCTENGYAKVQMLSTGGGELMTAWSNDNSMAQPGPVNLLPGTEPLGAAGATGHGYFLVSWSDATCSQAQAEMPKYWAITLPTSGFETDVTDVDTSMVCGGAVKVGPIKSAPYN